MTRKTNQERKHGLPGVIHYKNKHLRRLEQCNPVKHKTTKDIIDELNKFLKEK